MVFNGRYNCFFVLFCFFMRVCSKRDVFVCKARFCPFQPEEACSDKGAEKGNKLTPEQVTQMFGPSNLLVLRLVPHKTIFRLQN